MKHSILKKVKRKLGLFFINTFFCGTHAFGVKRLLLKFAGISVGSCSKIVGPIKIGTVASLKIGENVFINHDFNIEGNGSVIIGARVAIGPNVRILTGSHLIGTSSMRAGEGLDLNVIIEDGCWVGASTNILGCKIESGSVVGCCALVNKDVPSDVLVGGIPAKFIKNLD